MLRWDVEIVAVGGVRCFLPEKISARLTQDNVDDHVIDFGMTHPETCFNVCDP